MKIFYALLIICSSIGLRLHAQSSVYSLPIDVTDMYMRDSVRVLGKMDLEFPVDGTVFIQFDGQGTGSAKDRIIMAANIYPDWDTNEGNVNFYSTVDNESHCFSHTRIFPVTAGQHSFYAVGHNYVDIEGTGIASIHGTLYVEFIPDSQGIITVHSLKSQSIAVMSPVAYDTLTIDVPGPGVIDFRLNGTVSLEDEDIVAIGLSESPVWDASSDPNAYVLIPKHKNENNPSISQSYLLNAPAAGSYTLYAFAQRLKELEWTSYIYPYSNFQARFYPESSDQLLNSKDISLQNFELSTTVSIMDSIQMEIEHPGKIEFRLGGMLQSPLGDTILMSINNAPLHDTAIKINRFLTLVDTIDRHVVDETRVFDVQPGKNTFYLIGQLATGTEVAGINMTGNMLLKYYPEKTTVSTWPQLEELSFTVVPNPANDHLTIQHENMEEPVDILITDLQGRQMMYTTRTTQSRLDISSLLPGVYYVRISRDGAVGTQKLMVY